MRLLEDLLPLRVLPKVAPRLVAGDSTWISQDVDKGVLGLGAIRRHPVAHEFHTVLPENPIGMFSKTLVQGIELSFMRGVSTHLEKTILALFGIGNVSR